MPYFILALLLLTSVLLAQQATRFAEILGAARAPLEMALEVSLGLLPNILIFTLPMAVLAGTAIGFSRMGSDSELIAMRAAGIGNWRIVAPPVLFGLLMSAATLYIGMELAPSAAYGLRQTAIRAALYRLESPVEPRTFNTEIPGKIIYVRDGDRESGQWGRVFIYWQEQEGGVRLVTARSGRIDSSGEQSELVLSDASVTTLPTKDSKESLLRLRGETAQTPSPGAPKEITTERSTQLRIRDDRLNRERGELLKRLRARQLEFDEMGWRELLERRRTAKERATRRAAAFAFHRRLALCTAPIGFALLGAAIGLRMRRGGRGLGMFLSLSAMIAYYLLALAGEYLVRVEAVPIRVGAWLSTAAALLLGVCLLILRTGSGSLWFALWWGRREPPSAEGGEAAAPSVSKSRRPGRPLFSGLLDRTMLRALTGNFSMAFLTLIAIFLIFTLFELLRFIATSGAGAYLVGRYMLFLLPLVMVALAPMSVLVAVLVSYALLARRSEAVAWWACGQSVYRLALPGLIFAACIGLGLWGVQERLMPRANRLQNNLRNQIRSGLSKGTQRGRNWLASASGSGALYSYEFDEKSRELRAPLVYEFDAEGIHIRRLVSAERAHWNEKGALELENAEIVQIERDATAGGGLRRVASETISAIEPPEAFKPVLNTPAEMDIKQLSSYIRSLKRRGESPGTSTPLTVALERKRAEPFSPVVMALVGIPLALAFGRRSAIAALCAAVAIGLTFWGATSGFQQLGNYGLLPAKIAVWSPLVIFASAGVYLLFRART